MKHFIPKAWKTKLDANARLKALTGIANTIPSWAVSKESDLSGRVAAKPRAIRRMVKTISLAIFLFLSRSSSWVMSRIIFFGVFSWCERLELSELVIWIQLSFIRKAMDKDRMDFPYFKWTVPWSYISFISGLPDWHRYTRLQYNRHTAFKDYKKSCGLVMMPFLFNLVYQEKG